MGRSIALFVSIIMHPIFVLPLLLLFTYFSCSHLFVFSDSKGMGLFVIYSTVTALILPLVGLAMMRGLGLISTWQIEDKQERIGPLILTGLFYIWLFYNYYKSGDVPEPVQVVTLGAAIALFIAFFVNNFSKISLHGVGVGGLIIGLVIISLKWSFSYTMLGSTIQVHNLVFILTAMVLGGAALSSRLYLGVHTLQQVYHGFLVGIIGTVLALNILT